LPIQGSRKRHRSESSDLKIQESMEKLVRKVRRQIACRESQMSVQGIEKLSKVKLEMIAHFIHLRLLIYPGAIFTT
jgi:hypothetical protein